MNNNQEPVPHVTDSVSGPPKTPIQNPWIIFGIFITMIIIVISLSITLWNFRDRQNANSHVVKEFSGTGNGETEYFKVHNPWEIRWQHQGHITAIEWLGKETKGESYVEMHKKPIRDYGQKYIGLDGEFRLKVTGEGPWKIQVRQFESQPPKSVH